MPFSPQRIFDIADITAELLHLQSSRPSPFLRFHAFTSPEMFSIVQPDAAAAEFTPTHAAASPPDYSRRHLSLRFRRLATACRAV